jgi:hypothetical protein
VVVSRCCVVPWLVTMQMVTTLGTSSPSDEAACPEGTVDVLLRRPPVGAHWVGDVAGRCLLIVSRDGWGDSKRGTHHLVQP